MPRQLLTVCVGLACALAISIASAVAEPAPKRGGILHWFTYAEPSRFDIHTATFLSTLQALSGLYSGLLQWGPENPMQVSPDLAERWESSADNTIYTFHLRDLVKWHDGEFFSSADVLYSLNRVLSPDVRSPRCGLALRQFVKQVTAPDNETVVIELQFPTKMILPVLASAWCKILPKHILERDGDLSIRGVQVGTGPFKLKRYVPGGVIEWERNPDYYSKIYPYLDGVKQFIIKSHQTQLIALKAGKVDFWHSWPPMTQQEIADVRKSRGEDLVSQEAALDGFMQIYLNAQKAPFDNPDMRRAVYLAIDRQAIIDKAQDGAGIPCVILPRVLFGDYALPKAEVMQAPGCRHPKNADVAEAKKLVTKQYPQGVDIEVSVRSVGNYVSIARQVTKQLEPIGIRGQLKIYESSAGEQSWERGVFIMVGAQSSSLMLMDPSGPLGLSWITDGSKNYGRLSIPDLDHLYEQGLRESDTTQRQAIYHKFQRRVMDGTTAAVTIGWTIGPWLMLKKIKGWSPGPTVYDSINFQAMWMDP